MALLKTIFSETYWMQLDECVSERATTEAFLDNPQKSMVVSTLLVRFSLCKLGAHAEGSAKNETLSILGMKSNVTTCYTSVADAMLATIDLDMLLYNKMIFDYRINVSAPFLNSTTNFGVTVDQTSFKYPKLAVSFVNQWIDKSSIRRISDVLDVDDIDNKTSFLIVSATYLKVTWEFPFDIRLTKNMKFHHHDGNISIVPMMKRTVTCLYLEDPITVIFLCYVSIYLILQILNILDPNTCFFFFINFHSQFVNLKLAAFGMSLTIAVPSTPRHLVELIQQLSPQTLQGVYNRMEYENVDVMLPRFKIKSGVDWNKYLKKIGLHTAFNETNSGLNGILTQNSQIKNIYLSKVKQKCVIDVDEMGIYRHKVDDRNSFNDPHQLRDNYGPIVKVDHPFLFFVNLQKDPSNRLDMNELITGVYYGPDY
ncbi:serine protease inhibitor 3/4-like [Bicyclus anynana]|uniref:Serine protease inhibitor 3/4-like n=1 Tax=Bicyclus anynana TaxID=110368 RepID=A0ABM3LGD4_BICAN|nr:serine protease inhibitor 3/4-like [Bicyclus anynana]